MAPRGRQARRKGRRGDVPAWMWVATGLVLGLAIATAVVLSGRVPLETLRREATTAPTPGTGGDTESTGEARSQDKRDSGDERRYDFYRVLPEMEVVIPDEEIAERAKKRERDKGGPYVLQAGSFRDQGEAERLKAQLALLGVRATVRTVRIDDQTWHRVRAGPYDSARKLDALRRRLRENDIDAMVLEDKG